MLKTERSSKSEKAVRLYRQIAENKRRLLRMQEELSACLDDMTQSEMTDYAYESFEIDKFYKKKGD